MGNLGGGVGGGGGVAVGAIWDPEFSDYDDVCTEEGIRHIGRYYLRETKVQSKEFVLGEYDYDKNNYKLTFDCPPFISSCKQIVLKRQGKATIEIYGN